ncbi:HDOD domain-containing protein [Aestuariibacter sp. AA17]|uniref:HDOD domain-containing protein n=1 Tax=Fluctibacter corallii TaxID=2984329 RepID=A0ABT3A9F2_9ALTE|nr:HDOD domain-containing protein [Aestuariibacter sp. AA17]MCV2885212.1 HDOD domain-containing protein [Aestuariibacter sp. AA17]
MNALECANQAVDVFVLPDAVMRVKELIDDDSASMQDIADVVNFDPALMSQVLRVANSAIYNFPKSIDTVSKAVQVIGSNSIYDLVVGYGVSKAFGSVDPNVIELDKYWEKSVTCALLCKYLADKLGAEEPERLFVSGLLHNIGELVVVQFQPEMAAKCAQYDESVTPEALQQQHLSTTYAQIGGELIAAWGLPESIAQTIKHQHFAYTEAKNLDEKIMQLAYVLTLDNSHPEFYAGNANVDPEMYDRLNLDLADLQAALDFTNLQALSVLALFSPSSASIY